MLYYIPVSGVSKFFLQELSELEAVTTLWSPVNTILMNQQAKRSDFAGGVIDPNFQGELCRATVTQTGVHLELRVFQGISWLLIY